jgi:gluconokinase
LKTVPSFPRRGRKAFAILALDLGTSSCRSAIYDADGHRLLPTTAQLRHSSQTDPDGRAELQPAELARNVGRIVARTLRIYRAAKSTRVPIGGIGVSCFWHSLLGLDAQGRPLTPIYTWADSRCRHDAEILRRRSGEAAIHARTGCMARSSFWPAKLLWLRRTQPGLFRQVVRWVSPAEWIQEQWCGAANVSLSMASATGLLDGRALRWDRSLLRRCTLSVDRLNPLSENPAMVLPAFARRHPELRDVPWFPAIGDGAASNLGSGAVLPGIAAINVGTSAALRVVVPSRPALRRPLAPPGLFAYRLDFRRQVIGGAVSNAGNIREWALRELRLPDLARLEKLLGERSMPVDHLTVLPFWTAERAPTWPEDLPSVIVGITQATTALDLLQALQEATYQRLAQIAETVEKAVGRKLTFLVSGGIRQSPNSLQRLANVLGRPVHPSVELEASLRGAAVFALERLGLHPPPIPRAPVIRPEPAAARAYVRARERQARLERQSEIILA